MEHSGFFNALNNDGVYDRKYNANDYSDNLAVIIGNGVLRSTNDDLKVTATGLVVSVAVGRAWINGHYYKNDSIYSFSATSAPISGQRYDRVMLRFDNSLSERQIHLVYVQGTASSAPVKPTPTREGNIYDLVLADVFVNTNATSLTITDMRSDTSVCGWVYSTSGDNSFFTSLDNSFNTWFQNAKNTLSSVTLFKRYTQDITIASATSTVSFNIPQYDSNTCFLEVYVNGIFDRRHTISNSIITFTGTLVAGTKVTVNVYKSIDGTGIQSVSGEITQLQQQYATLSGINKWTYVCTGLNDNLSLSQIAQAIYAGSYTSADVTTAANTFLTALGGNTFLASLPSDFQATISIVGSLGVTTPFAGAGTASDRYKWFSLGIQASNSKRIVFDFAKCSKINISCSANTNNIIFYGTDLFVKNANVDATTTNANCIITMVVGGNNFGKQQFTDCRLKIVTTGLAIISKNGEFTNCILHTKSSGNNSYAFNCDETECFVRMNGGSVFNYVGDSTKIAAAFNITSTATNAVIMAVNISAPTIAQSGYYQKSLAIANAGKIQIYNVCSTITSTGATANLDIEGQIWKSKY